MNKCSITTDLLPLYIEKICSQESREFVDNHLAECPDCKMKHEQMRGEISNADNGDMVISEYALKRSIKKYRDYFSIKGGTIAAYILSIVFLDIFIYLMIISYGYYYDKLFTAVAWVSIVPFLMLVTTTITGVVRSIKNKAKSMKKRIIFIAGIVVITILSSYIFFLAHATASSTVCSNSINSKTIEGERYYFEISDFENRAVRLECDNKTYEALIVDEDVLYDISYRTILFYGIGYLGTIDTEDYIDNRS
jgi:hypothetical protein